MTSQTLSRVTLESIENYRTAATEVVVAYRLGGHRLVRVVNGALRRSVYPPTARLAPRTAEHMNEVRGNVAEVVVKGIDRVAERAEKVIELSSTTAAAQVTKVAKFAAGVENEVVFDGLQAAARLTMPGAKFALVVSGRVAKGATALAEAAGARPAQKAVRKAAPKRKLAPVTRKAKATVKTATRRVAKAAKAVQAPLARAPRAARAKKAVAAEATA